MRSIRSLLLLQTETVRRQARRHRSLYVLVQLPDDVNDLVGERELELLGHARAH